MSVASEGVVRAALEASGFSVSRVPRGSGRSADFFVRDDQHSYLVEVTHKQVAGDFGDYLRELSSNGYASLTRSIERSNRLDGIVRDKALQLAQTPANPDFRILWITADAEDSAHMVEMLFRTLFGVASLCALGNSSGLFKQPQFVECFYYDHFSFYHHRALDGVAFSSDEHVCLFPNPLAHTAASFRSSGFCQAFAVRSGLVDPDVLALDPDTLALDLEADRTSEKAKQVAVRHKYDLSTVRSATSTFTGRVRIDLPSSDGGQPNK